MPSSRFRLAFAAMLIVSALLLFGCEKKESESAASAPDKSAEAPPAETTPTAPTGIGLVSNADAYYVLYRIHEGEIPMNEPFGIEVFIYDAEKRSEPLADVDLAVDARMPDHGHGMVRNPTVTRNDDGGFTINGMLFHMLGYWELYFDVTRDGQTERAQTEVTLE